ncbi:unnamed protein product, partial [Larinioides sclopetarius]
SLGQSTGKRCGLTKNRLKKVFRGINRREERLV